MQSDHAPQAFNLTAAWQDIAVAYSQAPPGEQYTQFDRPELSVVLAPQRSTWRLADGTGSTIAIPPGSLCLYTLPEIWWRWECPAEALHISLSPELLTKAAIDCGLPNFELENRLVFTDAMILQIAHLLQTELQSGDRPAKLHIESLANVLAVHLLRKYSGSERQFLVDNRPFNSIQTRQIQDFIHTHLSEDLSIAALAAVVHMSPFHFARVFKAAIGQTPHFYVTQQRIERSKSLLRTTKLSIEEVGNSVGFVNKSHFAAQFRKLTGTTPTRYRADF